MEFFSNKIFFKMNIRNFLMQLFSNFIEQHLTPIKIGVMRDQFLVALFGVSPLRIS